MSEHDIYIYIPLKEWEVKEDKLLEFDFMISLINQIEDIPDADYWDFIEQN